MRAITVRQPWAWAIIHGGKDVENRTRNIAGAHRGLVAIHAGLHKFEQNNDASRAHRAAFRSEVDTALHFGAIIGVVDLADVHWSGMECSRGHVPCHEYAPCSPWSQAYHHHLTLTAPVALPRPIPCKGRLGLWTLPDEIGARVAGQLGEVLSGVTA